MQNYKNHPIPAPPRSRGITLIEVLVTLVIAGILVGIGAPSFTNMLGKYRAGGEHSALLSDLVLAREQAKNSASPVTVCASSNGTACTQTAWHQGHIVFGDAGTAGQVDGNDAVVRLTAAAKSGITMVPTIQSTGAEYTSNFLRFDTDGKLVGANALQFTTCLKDQQAQLIVVRLNGHVSASTGSTPCE